MPFESLEPELAAHLTAICQAQTSGHLEPRMVFRPGTGLIGISRTGGDEQVIADDLERNDLRALATHDYVSLATPRAHWFVTATAKALTEFLED
ncbi:MAG: hypothetical protein AAGH99_13790 [Planctomycetota bacterium]